MLYQTYFTDFTGNIFTTSMNDDGYADISSELHNYLSIYHNIKRHKFTPSSLAFVYNECAFNIIEYIDRLNVYDKFLDDIYVVCPCHKRHDLPEIDYQSVISGNPYYLGNSWFTKRNIEPEPDAMRREVKEESFLSLYEQDVDGRVVHNFDMCFLTDTTLPYLSQNSKLCIDHYNIEIYGDWAKQRGLDLMTSDDITKLEDDLVIYRQNRNFNKNFVFHKVALMVLGGLDSLLEFYTKDIFTTPPAPHMDIRPNDFAVLLVPVRLIYMMCQKYIASKHRSKDRRLSKNLPI